MRKVISNTTPILSLLKIDRLHILEDLYHTLIVPEAVFWEIEKGKQKPYYRDLSKLNWLSIQAISNRSALDYFFDLDRGEAEVLVLAKEIQADLVILDENLGRRYAKQLSLSLTGTVGILLKSKQQGIIPSVKVGYLHSSLHKPYSWPKNNYYPRLS